MTAPNVPFPAARLGARMREQRLLKRLTIADIARETGLTQSTVRKIERGAGGCHAAALLAVADVLAVSVDWLLGRDAYAAEAPGASLSSHPDDVRTLRIVAMGLAQARDPRVSARRWSIS